MISAEALMRGKTISAFVIAILSTSLCLRSAASGQNITLIENGASRYLIVIPENPDETTAYAAGELSRFLKEIGGAELEVVQNEKSAAAPAMMDYIKALHKNVFKKSIHANLYSSPADGFLDREMLEYADECFDRAEKAAAEAPEVLDRVRRARLPLTYVKLKAPQLYGWRADEAVPGGRHDQAERLARFSKDLERFRITIISELESLQQSLEKIRVAIERK